MKRFQEPPEWGESLLGRFGSDGGFHSMAKRAAPSLAASREAVADVVERPAKESSLVDSIRFECERLAIPFTVDGIAEAFANAEIDDAPSTDAISNHIGGETKLSPGAKGLNRKTIRAYGQLFNLVDPSSLQRPSHISDRMTELSKPANTVARHTIAAKNAKLSDAQQRLVSLWGGPHQSLAFFLLDYLADG